VPAKAKMLGLRQAFAKCCSSTYNTIAAQHILGAIEQVSHPVLSGIESFPPQMSAVVQIRLKVYVPVERYYLSTISIDFGTHVFCLTAASQASFHHHSHLSFEP
jgi:hypothetical protein